MRVFRICLWLVLGSLSLTSLPQEQGASISISTPEEIKAEFASVPCKNEARLPAVKALFEKAGAATDDITIETIKEVENIVIKKAGTTEEKIIVGAHYDVAGAGSCGAIDNWTGIVTLAHLYKTLKNLRTKKTILFVGFGKEEQGLVGSKAMAKQIKKEELKQYCAMVNIDSLGLTAPQIITNLTSGKLEEAATKIAKKMEMPFQALAVDGALADSVSFRDRGVPSITLAALPANWSQILHHSDDQANKINANSVYLGYRLALALIAQISDSECGAFR
jgi:Zn-dependent M28 family amino/carboxypeptidase